MVGLVVQFRIGRSLAHGLVLRRWGHTGRYGVWQVRGRSGRTLLVHGSSIVRVYKRVESLGGVGCREADLYP